jgi:hypothetical protein
VLSFPFFTLVAKNDTVLDDPNDRKLEIVKLISIIKFQFRRKTRPVDNLCIKKNVPDVILDVIYVCNRFGSGWGAG